MRHLLLTGVALVRAGHPLPSATVTVVTAGLAAATGRPSGQVAVVAVAVLAGQLSVGWLNDLVDARRDALVGRRGKPVASGRVAPALVWWAVGVSALVAVGLSWVSGAGAALVHLVALASAWAYDLGLKATPVSAATYAVSFGLLPVFVTLGLPGAPVPPPWLVCAAAALGCAAHFVNVLPDLADDRVVGVRGLPHRLGARVSLLVAVVLVVVATVLLVVGPGGGAGGVRLAALPVTGVVLGVGLVLHRRERSRAAFRAVLLVAALDVGLLLSAGGLVVGAAHEVRGPDPR
ncbi:UbiA family prenyltransferase [Streptoalloteichus tenebrarius]|uniref:UbiA family prenyltransferase n=1 Tax=Streptoalloteichus tenebrarius (strain ATCC 17920 / DSM 40477 / JCM 4838 / CBS 697.72 / NBRC 16177 / NCIMB 11028 / NRRL B-12390 / A12253. 1 / ISP 5477) TaxID=1933 RepID=UPI0020A55CF8|nr:UbiA family prenyltransferase [Streptoalloteichus tenebrarius]